jgi:hypothetical protein
MMAGHGMHDDEAVFDPGREWAVYRCMHGCLHVLLDRVSLTFTVEEFRAVQNLMQRAAIAFNTDAPRRDSECMH